MVSLRLLLLVLTTACCCPDKSWSVLAATGRANRDPANEPDSIQAHNSYRTLFADPNHYLLAEAGLLDPERDVGPELLESRPQPDGSYRKYPFKFSMRDWLFRFWDVLWYVTLEDKLATQVYDRPTDLELAAGPQVDQRQCAIHLDYLLGQFKQHLSSDWDQLEHLALFRILTSLDSPNRGVARGANMFPGDHDLCVSSQFLIDRQQLARQIGQSEADQYFVEQAQTAKPEQQTRWIPKWLAPFFGFKPGPKRVSLKPHSSQILGQPMRYCLTGIRYKSWSNTSHHLRNANFRLGTCLPASCDSRSLEGQRDKIKRLLDLNMRPHQLQYYINDLYCLPDPESPLRNPWNFASTRNFILFNMVWILLLLAASARSFLKQVSESSFNHHLLDCWSIQTNLSKFWSAHRTKLDQPGNRSAALSNSSSSTSSSLGSRASKKSNQQTLANDLSMEPLEGMKVVSSMFVITAHAFSLIFPQTWNRDSGHHMLSHSWINLVHVICPMSVNVFFVTTGILTSRILFKMPQSTLKRPLFWLQFVLYRYLRMVPLYLLVFWFLRSFYTFTGSGPLWDYGTSESALVSMCRQESWWRVILPTANLISPGVHCLGVGWYLANDIQFALVAPIFVLPYFLVGAKLAHSFIGLTVIVACLNHIRYYYQAAADPLGIFDWSLMTLARVLNDNSSGYTLPQYRIPAFLIGIAVGHYSVQLELRPDLVKNWPKTLLLGAKLFVGLVFYLLLNFTSIATLIPLSDRATVKILNAIYNGISHIVTSLACGAFTILLATGHFQKVARFLSSGFMKTISNTSLAETLIHIPLILYQIQRYTSLPELSFHMVITQTFVWFVESYLLAAIVHVLYELPMRRFFVKLMVAISRPQKTSAAPSNKQQLHLNKPTNKLKKTS